MTTPYTFAQLLWSMQSHLHWAKQMFITWPQMGFRTGHLGLFYLHHSLAGLALY